MILFIDTADNLVKLSLQGKKIFRHEFGAQDLSVKLVPEIKKFLQKNKIKFDQVAQIQMNADPKWFSKTRTTVAVVNALTFALGLPQKLVEPIYSQEPNITLKKK